MNSGSSGGDYEPYAGGRGVNSFLIDDDDVHECIDDWIDDGRRTDVVFLCLLRPGQDRPYHEQSEDHAGEGGGVSEVLQIFIRGSGAKIPVMTLIREDL